MLRKETSIDEAFQQVGFGFGSFCLVAMTGMIFLAAAAEWGFAAYAVQPLEHDWGLTASKVVFLEQAVLSGQMVGPLFWGRLADRRGRRPAILGCAFTVLVCGLLTAAASNYQQLLVAQVGVGFGASGIFLCMDILCELLPKEGSGPFCNALQFFWPAGNTFLLLCAWATLDSLGWRALSLAAAIPVVAAFFLALQFLPESPHWLLEQGRKAKAREVLEGLAKFNGASTSFGTLASPEDAEHVEQVDCVGCSSWTGHTGKLCALLVLWFLMDTVYMSTILLGPLLFRKPAEVAGNFEDAKTLDYFPLTLSSCSELMSVTLSLVLLDRLGLCNFQFYMYLVAGVAALGVSFRDGLPYSVLVAAVVIARGATFAASCGTWVHTPELFPVEIRGTAHAACTVARSIGALMAPMLVSKFVSPTVCGATMSAAVVAAAFIARHLPETRPPSSDLYDPSCYVSLSGVPFANRPEIQPEMSVNSEDDDAVKGA